MQIDRSASTMRSGHKIRDDVPQSERRADAECSDPPLNVTQAITENDAREENACERNRASRDYLDHVVYIGLQLKSFQTRAVGT